MFCSFPQPFRYMLAVLLCTSPRCWWLCFVQGPLPGKSYLVHGLSHLYADDCQSLCAAALLLLIPHIQLPSGHFYLNVFQAFPIQPLSRKGNSSAVSQPQTNSSISYFSGWHCYPPSNPNQNWGLDPYPFLFLTSLIQLVTKSFR